MLRSIATDSQLVVRFASGPQCINSIISSHKALFLSQSLLLVLKYLCHTKLSREHHRCTRTRWKQDAWGRQIHLSRWCSRIASRRDDISRCGQNPILCLDYIDAFIGLFLGLLNKDIGVKVAGWQCRSRYWRCIWPPCRWWWQVRESPPNTLKI